MIQELKFSQDFNQMLVSSVFIHILILTSLLFIPKPQLQQKVIIPTFMVDIEKASGEPEEGVVEKVLETPNQAKTTKELSVEKSLTKKVADSKIKKGVLLQDSSVQLSKQIEEFELLAKTNVPQNLFSAKKFPRSSLEVSRELEKLKKKVVSQKPKQIARKKLIQEAAFKQTPFTPRKTKPARPFNFPEVKVPESLQKGQNDIRAKFTEKKIQPEIDLKSKMEPLQSAKSEEIKDEKPVFALGRNFESLLQDLELLDQSVKTVATVQPELVSPTKPGKKKKIAPEKALKPQIKQQKNGGAFANISKKLLGSEERKIVEIQIGSPEAIAMKKEFVSHIRETMREKLLNPKTLESKLLGFSGATGVSPEPLSIYVGQIKKIIDSHWRTPLGVEHKKEIVASFFLYSAGNIDRPQMKISSGTNELDSLAIKAILDSVPFPKFPVELMESLPEPNLHITMHFKLTTGQ